MHFISRGKSRDQKKFKFSRYLRLFNMTLCGWHLQCPRWSQPHISVASVLFLPNLHITYLLLCLPSDPSDRVIAVSVLGRCEKRLLCSRCSLLICKLSPRDWKILKDSKIPATLLNNICRRKKNPQNVFIVHSQFIPATVRDCVQHEPDTLHAVNMTVLMPVSVGNEEVRVTCASLVSNSLHLYLTSLSIVAAFIRKLHHFTVSTRLFGNCRETELKGKTSIVLFKYWL